MDALFHKDKPSTTTATGTTGDHHKTTTGTTGNHPKPTNSELLSSAKVVADAIGGKEVDKGKVAGAAADLLDAAATYGKFDEKQGMGKYMDQAENYLHKYNTSHTTTTTTTKTDAAGHKTTTETTSTTTHAAAPSDDEKKHGGGYGDVMKMAEGMFKKH